MISYRRRRIGKPLFDEIAAGVDRGESAVVLSPRYGGKRHVLKKLADKFILPEMDGAAYVRSVARFAQPGGIEESHEPQTATSALIAFIDAYIARTEKPFLLLAAGIDDMPQHVARAFLAQVRTRVFARTLVVVLAGETNLRELVHGPNSEFNCATQYILQGYDDTEFSDALGEYERSLLITWTSREAALACLAKKTGGSAYLMRLLISVVLDWRAEKKIAPLDPLDPLQLYSYQFRKNTLPDAYWSHVLRHATNAISSDPHSWELLERLMAADSGEVVIDLWEPHTLELAGVAVYDETARMLRFRSPLIADFIQSHYTVRARGDLFAVNGKWEEAFARYSMVPEGERARPAGVDDLHEVESLVRSLGSAFRRAAIEGPPPVETLFRRGCRLLLGFPEVVCWSRVNGGGWQPELAEEPLSNAASRNCIDLLTKPQAHDENLARSESSSALCFPLAADHESRERTAIVGNIENKVLMSLKRCQLLTQLGHDFRQAHEHAVSVQRGRNRLQVRNKHIEIVTNVFSGLGSKLLDTPSVLRVCATGLRELGYKRVMFSIVNPERTRIIGEWDEPGTPLDLAKITDFSLSDPERDVQPWVVHNRTPMVIRDARIDRLCRPEAVTGAGIIAMAVIPMLDHLGDVFGTIHVEREDELVPGESEVEDLVNFGREVSGILAQSRRMTMIYSALNKVPEPLLISDRALNLKFANEPSQRLFGGITAGWQDPPLGISDRPELKPVLDWLNQALVSERGLTRVKGLGVRGEFEGEVLLGRIDGIGAFVHIVDQTFLAEIFSAISSITSARNTDEVVRCVFKATEKLGFQKRRYYVAAKNGEILESKRAEGHGDVADSQFNAGRITLTRETESAFTCLDEDRPGIFVWLPGSDAQSTHQRNSWGLEVRVVRQEAFQDLLGKRSGDVRVDLPLKSGSRAIGKITVERKEEIKPEEFELLRVLSSQVQATLQAFEQGERMVQLETLEQATSRAFAIASHQFRNELTPIEIDLTRYRLAADGSVEFGTAITRINGRLEADIESLHKIVDRMPELLGNVIVRPTSFDLCALIKECAVKTSIPVHVHHEAGFDLNIEGDLHHLTTVFTELLDNTKDMSSGVTRNPEVEVVLADRPGGVIEISYHDNGPGIPDAIRDMKIFEMGFSYRPKQHPGSGIGMNYVRRVLIAHGGNIYAVKVLKGAKFLMEIPRVHRG